MAQDNEKQRRSWPDQHDFTWWKQLGKGSFGTIWLVQEKLDPKRYLAIKTLTKKSIVEGQDTDQQRKVQRVLNERQILQFLDHPFIVKLLYFFQDDHRLYFGMTLAACGDFFTLLEEVNDGAGLGLVACRFYGAELTLALEYIHSVGVVHGDMKLENILLDKDGHCVMTDFGMAQYHNSKSCTSSKGGTPEYFSPEIVKGETYGISSDWWAFGVALYEMLCGQSPFTGRTIGQTMKNIVMKKAQLPTRVGRGTSRQEVRHTQELLDGLMNKNPSLRLGASGASGANDNLKEHPWFNYKLQMNTNVINSAWTWEDVIEKKIPTPLKRHNILESTAIKALFDARSAKDKEDLETFHQFKPYTRNMKNDITEEEMKLPPLKLVDVKEIKPHETDSGIEQKKLRAFHWQENDHQISELPHIDSDRRRHSVPVNNTMINPEVQDKTAPVLRVVSYKIKGGVFDSDPRGQDTGIEAFQAEVNQLWRAVVKGYDFFGIKYKKETQLLTLSMVFRTSKYLEEYKKTSLNDIFQIIRRKLETKIPQNPGMNPKDSQYMEAAIDEEIVLDQSRRPFNT